MRLLHSLAGWLWVPASAGATREGSIFHSFVVPANAGTHTLCSFVLVAVATTFSLIERRWLSVPAFAGTTKEDSSNGQTVIASGAKQSISRQRKYGLLRRFAPRNDVAPIPDTTSSPRREAPESLHKISRPREGVGNAGCPLHPQPRVRFALVKMH